MSALHLLLLVGWPAFSQVVIQATPETAVLGLIQWNLSLCNNSARPVVIPVERIRMALPSVRSIDAEHAKARLAHRQASSFPAKAVRGLEYLEIGGAAVSGSDLVSLNPEAKKKVLFSLALGIGLTHVVADKLKREIPAVAAYTANLLDAPVPLGPAQCATRSLFAIKTPRPAGVTATITLP